MKPESKDTVAAIIEALNQLPAELQEQILLMAEGAVMACDIIRKSA